MSYQTIDEAIREACTHGKLFPLYITAIARGYTSSPYRPRKSEPHITLQADGSMSGSISRLVVRCENYSHTDDDIVWVGVSCPILTDSPNTDGGQHDT